jgi:hypothetical protein
MPRIAIGLVFLSVAIGVHDAAAQDSRLYAGVSGMWSTQGSTIEISDPDTPAPGVGGTALGVVGEFGIFLLPPRVHEWTFSLSFEFSLPARFDSVQATDYDTVYLTDNRHRELVFSGLFHVHAPQIGPVHMALVAGPSIIQEDTLQSTTVPVDWCRYRDSGQSPGPDRSRGSANRADFSGDVASAFLGLGSWLVRPAVGIRLGF